MGMRLDLSIRNVARAAGGTEPCDDKAAWIDALEGAASIVGGDAGASR